MSTSTRIRALAASACALALIASPALAQEEAQIETYETQIIDATGDAIGTLELRGGANAVVGRVMIDASDLPPGWRAIHFHQVGDCSDVGEFQRSGGHIDFGDAAHGLLNPDGPEEGDLPNVWVHDDGSVRAEFATTLITLTGERSLRDEDGSALVLHAEPDDHMTQPIGGAGARIACAEISPAP